MPEFIPALQLCQSFYYDAVRPILDEHFPRLPHSAALLGYGSDILGFDTPVSRDHMWGPRVHLFLEPGGFQERKAAIYEVLRRQLPVRFRGYTTHFSPPDPNDGGVRHMIEVESGPVDPLIFFHTLQGLWHDYLRADPFQDPQPADWLTFPQQKLLEVTAGQVYHDDLGLQSARDRYSQCPHDVWLYLLASQWELIAQEEAFAGRTAQAGDELGSRILAARMVNTMMRLCFLMEKRYAPYSKWFGTAFQRLECSACLGLVFDDILSAASYPERDAAFARAYSLLAEMHNALNITPPLSTRTRTYSAWFRLRDEPDLPYDYQGTRPFQVISGGRFVEAIQAAIADPAVKSLPPARGSVSQFLRESSPELEDIGFCRGLIDDLTSR